MVLSSGATIGISVVAFIVIVISVILGVVLWPSSVSSPNVTPEPTKRPPTNQIAPLHLTLNNTETANANAANCSLVGSNWGRPATNTNDNYLMVQWVTNDGASNPSECDNMPYFLELSSNGEVASYLTSTTPVELYTIANNGGTFSNIFSPLYAENEVFSMFDNKAINPNCNVAVTSFTSKTKDGDESDGFVMGYVRSADKWTFYPSPYGTGTTTSGKNGLGRSLACGNNNLFIGVKLTNDNNPKPAVLACDYDFAANPASDPLFKTSTMSGFPLKGSAASTTEYANVITASDTKILVSDTGEKAVYLYSYDSKSSSLDFKWTMPNDDMFGRATAIYEKTVVIGGKDTVYVYQDHKLIQTLTTPNVSSGVTIDFGGTVSLSANALIVSSQGPNTSSYASYVFAYRANAVTGLYYAEDQFDPQYIVGNYGFSDDHVIHETIDGLSYTASVANAFLRYTN